MTSSVRSSRFHRVARVAVAAIALGVSAMTSVATASANPAPVRSPGYHCVPYSKFPTVRPGHHARVSTSFDGFAAVFTSSLPASASTTFMPYGMALHGTLTVESVGSVGTNCLSAPF